MLADRQRDMSRQTNRQTVHQGDESGLKESSIHQYKSFECLESLVSMDQFMVGLNRLVAVSVCICGP